VTAILKTTTQKKKKKTGASKKAPVKFIERKPKEIIAPVVAAKDFFGRPIKKVESSPKKSTESNAIPLSAVVAPQVSIRYKFHEGKKGVAITHLFAI